VATKKTSTRTKRKAVAKPRSKTKSTTPKYERVLVVSAHPDDPEFSAGGSVAKLAKDGAQVTYVIVTDGSQGGEDPKQKDSDLAGIREKEQRAAARVLGRQEGGVPGLQGRPPRARPEAAARHREDDPQVQAGSSSSHTFPADSSTLRSAARTLTTSPSAKLHSQRSIPTPATREPSGAY